MLKTSIKNMVQKSLIALQAMLIIAIFILASCTAPTETLQITPEENISAEQALLEKNASRYVRWERIAGLDNCRDIAAYDNVYVISADGKTIYEKKASSNAFLPMTAVLGGNFESDPAIKIAAGNNMEFHHNGSTFLGVAVITEGKKVYALAGMDTPMGYVTAWSNTPDNILGTPIDIAVASDMGIYVTTRLVNPVEARYEDLLYRFDPSSSVWMEEFHKTFVPETVALDIHKAYDHGNFIEGKGLKILNKTGEVYDIYPPAYYLSTMTTVGIAPSKDIAADKSSDINNICYATFHNNSSTVYYIDPLNETSKNCGAARRISISRDKYLWDAYSSGIWRAKL